MQELALINLNFILFCLQRYKDEGHDTIILAGAEYGSGSSRDWAAKGPMLQVSSFMFVVISISSCLFLVFPIFNITGTLSWL